MAAKPAAPAPVPNLDDFEVVLPDGMTVDQLVASTSGTGRTPDQVELDDLAAGGGARRAAAPPVAAAPTPPAAAPVPEPAAPVPPAAPKSPAAPPGVLAERRRRQDTEAENARLQRELDEANSRSRQILAQQKAEQVKRASTPTKVVLSDADLLKLRAQADEAKDQGEAAVIGARFAVERFNAALEDQTRKIAAVTQPVNNVRELEEKFIEEHADYDDVMHRAGVLRRLEVDPTTGTWRDPGLGELIYKAENPPQKAYELAKQMLRKRGLLKDEEPAPGEVEDGQPAAATNGAARAAEPTAPVAAAPAPDAIAEAERRGRAAAVSEITDQNQVRGRGIRAIPSAGGPPKAVFDKKALDDLMYRDYDKYLALCAANPSLEFDHMSA